MSESESEPEYAMRMETLVAAGVDPNARMRVRRSWRSKRTQWVSRSRYVVAPLLVRLLRGNATAAAAALIDRGADVNAGAEVDCSPLMAAAQLREDAPAMVQFLLERGADPAFANGRGETALHYLFEEVRDVFEERQEGAESLEVGEEGGPPLPEYVLGLVDTLVAAGADVDARTASGETPLAKLADDGQLNRTACREMVTRGADPTWALHWSLAHSYDSVSVKILVQEGAALNSHICGSDLPRAFRSTPLTTFLSGWGARGFMGPSHVRLLLEHGADPNLPDTSQHNVGHSKARPASRLPIDFLLTAHAKASHRMKCYVEAQRTALCAAGAKGGESVGVL
eukprot:TRINITY_DN16659_c0_g1_i1.p1 TRINITY_DN16659_c0_g1~~TRINITY_DN16659_c0_g1_i1.p1  ORF type:complete len:341 (+),score=57.68 TRINITY_DN16659_c0_g1_i1:150-1172(+)